MTFAAPNMLILLLILLPIVWYIGFPRMAFRRRRDVSSLLLRTLIIVFIVLALAGLQVVRTVDRLAVVFLVDASDSIGAELQAAQVDYIQAAVAEKPIDDEWSIIVFGADVSIDKPFNNIMDVTPIRSSVTGSNTNLAEAIQTAISLFPADARRRIVILSDGQQTIGDAESKARLAEASGVEISYVLFTRPPEPDVRITEFTAPATVAEGQQFDVTITIESEVDTDASLILYSGNALTETFEIEGGLTEGANTITFSQQSGETGFLNLSAQVVVPNSSDGFTQNNTLGTFSQIIGAPRILIVADSDDDISNLVPSLTSVGINVEIVSPANLPQEATALAVYESVLLVNVPALSLSNRQMELMQTYVRELGGGLVYIGGPDSYGPGGYFQTPIEAMLPVETQIRDQQRLPQLTIAYLVDSSGSMGASYDGNFTQLDLARRAISLSVDFLQPTDRAAVITFDSAGSLVAPFQNVADSQVIKEQIGTMRTGGGTNISAGLRTAERYLANEPSELKHLVVITDGGANDFGLVDMIERFNENYGVTTSVIAIGEATPPPFLRHMADAGQGNYHHLANVGQIPNVLAQETVLATRSYIQEGDFSVSRTAINPMLSGISGFPTLNGYIATSEKATSQVVLRGPEPYTDPLLVSWQYGLGRVVAFTGDATARWSTNWVTWNEFPRFWAQVVDYSITENAQAYLEPRVVMQDDHAHVVVDARDEDGTFLNNLVLETSVVAPDSISETVTLHQTAPGRYEATFVPDSEGAYFMNIEGRGMNASGQVVGFNELSGWVMSYSPEYRYTEPNEDLLRELAFITGGSSLQDTPADSFAITVEPRTAAAPVAPYLLVLVLILLPFDIAVRRLIITQSDIQRLQKYIFGSRLGEEHETRMSALRDARERARQRTQAGASDGDTLSALRRSKRDRDDAGDDEPAPTPATPATPTQPRSGFSPQAEPAKRDSVGTVGNLLKRKKSDD